MKTFLNYQHLAESCFPTLDNKWCVKTNVDVVTVATGSYFLYTARVIQIQVSFNSIQKVIVNLNQLLKGFYKLFLATYSKKIV